MTELIIEEIHFKGKQQFPHKNSTFDMNIFVAPNGNFYGILDRGLFKKYYVWGIYKEDKHTSKIMFGLASNTGHHILTDFYVLHSKGHYLEGYYSTNIKITHSIKPPRNGFMTEHEFKKLKSYCELVTPHHNSGEVELEVHKLKKLKK